METVETTETMIRTIAGRWLAVVAVLLGGALQVVGAPQTGTGAAQPTPARAVPDGGLISGGIPPDLFMVYTGDVIGFLDPCG